MQTSDDRARAASHARDAKRCSILERLQLLNAEPNPDFDRLTRVAARATGAPLALITFIGPDRQWIPSRVGWHRETTTLLEAFCVCALDDLELLEVADATLDFRFRDNPLVTGPEAIRFYAGQPLVFDGIVLGTLCVLANERRVLSPVERETLKDLAAMASDLIAQRNERMLREEHENRARALADTLQRSEAMLADAQRVARMCSWQLNLVTGETMFSTGLSQLVRRDSARLNFGEFQAIFRAPEWWQSVDLSQPVALELDTLGSDGQTRWFSWVSKPVQSARDEEDRIIGTLQDITAAKLAQRHLRTVEERFRLMWETTSDVVVMLDEQGRVQFVNPAVHVLFGHSPEAVVGQHLSMLQPQRLRESQQQGFQRYLDSATRQLNWRAVEAIGLHADGHEIPIEISLSEMALDGRRFVAACMRDVSARKASEARQNELALQLRNAQKMEAIGALAGGVAHDFNNVLAGILGNCALALDALDQRHAGDTARAVMLQIQKGGLRGRELVRQILSFARRQPKTLAICSLNALIEEHVDLLRANVPAGVQLRLDLSATDCAVNADSTQMGQVLANLATNACQSLNGASGTVEIGLQTCLLEPETAATLRLPAGRFAHLWVRDEGQGMDADTAARVFEPFFTTKAAGEGTGLGLAVVHGIVGAHGGSIVVDSSLGAGSVFHVYLPLSEATPTVDLQVPPPSLKQRGVGQHVLYVDDDEVMTIMVERLLQKQGYRPTVVGSAQAALALVSRDPGGFDLVVTDYEMPGLTGLQLAERLLAIRHDLPIVISSGNLTDDVCQQADRLGVRGLMHKENTIDDIGDMLGRVLA